MEQEKLESLFQEGRLIAACDNVIFPMIKLMQQQRMEQACARFSGGDREFVADIAYVQGLKELETKLRSLQRRSNSADYELNKSQI